MGQLKARPKAHESQRSHSKSHKSAGVKSPGHADSNSASAVHDVHYSEIHADALKRPGDYAAAQETTGRFTTGTTSLSGPVQQTTEAVRLDSSDGLLIGEGAVCCRTPELARTEAGVARVTLVVKRIWSSCRSGRLKLATSSKAAVQGFALAETML